MDTILYATGFDVEMSLQPFKQVGLSGEVQRLEPYAYYGITHPEFPNFFVLLGKRFWEYLFRLKKCSILQVRGRVSATTASSS